MELAGPQGIIRLISTAVCTLDHESGEAMEMAAPGRLVGLHCGYVTEPAAVIGVRQH